MRDGIPPIPLVFHRTRQLASNTGLFAGYPLASFSLWIKAWIIAWDPHGIVGFWVLDC